MYNIKGTRPGVQHPMRECLEGLPHDPIGHQRAWKRELSRRTRAGWTEEERARQNAKQKEAHRRKYHKWVYGLSDDEYQRLWDEQKGLCALCKKPRTLVVDHDHTTGRVRGLLCYGCNGGLGMLEGLLSEAIKYVNA